MSTEPSIEAQQPRTDLVQRGQVEDEIRRAGSRPCGWDGYSAEPPTPVAIEKAQQTLEMLYRLDSLPAKAVPMVDGGLALVIMVHPYYAAVEIYNDGEAVVAFSDRKQRHLAWEVSLEEAPLRAAMERLRELMHG